MSKRPSTGTSLSSRLRLPVGRLRDLPIWSKLGLIMIVPTIATIVVGTVGLIGNIGDANTADRARTLSGLSTDAAALIHELQNERANSIILLPNVGNADARNQFDRQAQLTEEAVKAYKVRSSAVTDVPEDFRERLTTIDDQLTDLTNMRKQVLSGEVFASTAAFNYRSLIEGLLAIRDSTAELAGNEHLGADLRAAAALSDLKEYMSLERVVVLRALTQGSMSPRLRQEFVAAVAGQQQALASFEVSAENWHRDLFNQTVTGSDLREAFRFQGLINAMTGEQLPGGDLNIARWDSAMVGKSNLMRKVEVELDEHNIEDATAARDVLQRTVLIQTGVLLGMLLLAILFAWLVARSMARSLRELRHGALTVAQYGLPQAVARLRDPALTTQMSPHQVALQIAEPLPVRSRDEFGQVAEAFNAVHLEAVRTAAEQAALRASVATMFVNLARRSQILVDRLIGHLDRLERGEEDPDRLAELFQLDHLATRMRRNDENLLVLAGADSSRIQREPAPLMDVIRAAQSEVEHYTRIEFGMIDRDIEIAAHAVNDMVHLVAELLDNATAFSPPDSAVVVEARRVGDRAVLLVEDRGIGVSPDQLAELNDRLANPPMVDVAVSRMMGLVVVARLAARHGVKVELRPARERGTVADVTLPSGVLVPRALAGRVTAGMPMAGQPSAGLRDTVSGRPPGHRPIAGSPLALESGSNGDREGVSPRGNLGAAAAFGGGVHSANAANGAYGPPPGANSRLAGNAMGGLAGGPRGSGAPGFGGPGDGSGDGGPGPYGHDDGSGNGSPGFGGGQAGGPGAGAYGSGGGFGGAGASGYATGPVGAPGGFGPGSIRPTSGIPTSGVPSSGMPTSGAPGGYGGGYGPRGFADGFGDASLPAAPSSGGPAGTPASRGLPAWSDLTGVNGQDLVAPPPAGGLGEPLPQRRSGDNWPLDNPSFPGVPNFDRSSFDQPGMGQPGMGQPGMGQPGMGRPGAPGADRFGAERPGERPDRDGYQRHGYGPDEETGPISRQRPVGPEARAEAPAGPGAPPPPAWPPVSPGAPPRPEFGHPLNEYPVDLTAEIPRVKLDWEPSSNEHDPGREAQEQRQRFVDETMELPIFRELESAWFRTQRRSPAPPTETFSQPTGSNGNGAPEAARPSVPRPEFVEPSAAQSPSADRSTAPSPVTWQTAADEGWQAAAALAEEHEFATTDTGLPKRVPMSQLVPGGVDKAAATVHKRTPEAVRGLLSAYHRGVQRGRGQQRPTDAKTPEPTSAGPQNSQGGKEHEA